MKTLTGNKIKIIHGNEVVGIENKDKIYSFNLGEGFLDFCSSLEKNNPSIGFAFLDENGIFKSDEAYCVIMKGIY